MTSPIRVLWQIVAPTGRHRPKHLRLLPDMPYEAPSMPVAHAVLSEAELRLLLDTDQVVANESAPCPRCRRATFHGMNRDGSRTCWTCGTTTGGAA